jgi:hypothetical protein
MLSRVLVRRIHLSRVAAGGVEWKKPDFILKWKASEGATTHFTGESPDRAIPAEECASEAPQIYGRFLMTHGNRGSWNYFVSYLKYLMWLCIAYNTMVMAAGMGLLKRFGNLPENA